MQIRIDFCKSRSRVHSWENLFERVDIGNLINFKDYRKFKLLSKQTCLNYSVSPTIPCLLCQFVLLKVEYWKRLQFLRVCLNHEILPFHCLYYISSLDLVFHHKLCHCFSVKNVQFSWILQPWISIFKKILGSGRKFNWLCSSATSARLSSKWILRYLRLLANQRSCFTAWWYSGGTN